MTTTASPRTHGVKRLEEKSADSKRFEIEGLIGLIWDFQVEITDIVAMTIEAVSLDRALQIADEVMEDVQSRTGVDSRKQYYYNIEQMD